MGRLQPGNPEVLKTSSCMVGRAANQPVLTKGKPTFGNLSTEE
jgi:hypothetical protein